MDTTEFTKAARKVHNDRYDYSQSEFKDWKTKLKIICRLHGSFFQKPSPHLKGAGCKPCADMARGEKRRIEAAATFQARSRSVHGDCYDYSKVKYQKSAEKVEVLCPEHGSFFIRPNNHVRGTGCPDCGTQAMADKQRMSHDEFLDQARKVHGDKYDYSGVQYHSFHKHVEIGCPVHGAFRQSPSGHLQGRGCVYCAAKINADRTRLNKEEFVQRARRVHGDTYDYLHVEYVSNMVPITIVCEKHGPFSQKPSKHIDAKQGCPSCANRDMNLEKFVERAREFHGDKYDYSKSIYRGARRKISIICSEHGSFSQSAYHHMTGIGCPLCVDTLNSRGSILIEAWLLENQFEFEREKTFNSLLSAKNSRYRLRWDFYLPEFGVLIEFDGQQHFHPNPHWGGMRAFEATQRNDALKNDWAKKNNYQLIRIRYDQVEEIEDILASKLGPLF